MHVNYAYLLDRCKEAGPHAKLLDYGCGGGDIVNEGLKQKLDIYGVDIFYDGGSCKNIIKEKGLLNTRVFEIEDNTIPFEDNHFDLIISNQVFEHVEHIDIVLSEIHRVLKPGGLFLTMFPSKDVWREGHCGIPLWHWSQGQGILRYLYGRCLRGLGFGYHTQNKSAKQWTYDFMQWLDQYTFYRSSKTLKIEFSKYLKISFNEVDYLKYRLKYAGRNKTAELLNNFLFRIPGVWLMRKLQGLLIEARKPL